MFIETKRRTLLKTVSWRAWATITTASLVVIFTGNFEMAAAIGGIEVVAKMILYFFHERLWNNFKFGKKEVQPAVYWLTGYSGAGKKDIAHEASLKLRDKGLKVEVLDGDKIRKIFTHVGYSREERNEHVRRIGFLASELEKHGIVVIVSMTSPFAESREFARAMAKSFVEVYVSTPKEVCERRDPKGLWKRARSGELEDFIGVQMEYEAPKKPEMSLDNSLLPAEECARKMVSFLY